VRVSAATSAEHKSRKAICAPPLELSRHAPLAHSRSWDTLGTEEATQIGANPWNEFLHEGALGLRATSKCYLTMGHIGEHTLLCSGMTGSSIQDDSSTFMDGPISFNISSWLSTSILTASCLDVCRGVDVLTSTGTCLVPRETVRVSHSTTLAFDLLWNTLAAFMPLGAMKYSEWLNCAL
jgi:hypothetical protein